MNAAIIIIGSILAIAGIGFATWSIIDTRKRYGENYKNGKRGVDE